MTRADRLIKKLAALDPARSPERTPAEHAERERIRSRIAETSTNSVTTTAAHRRMTRVPIRAGVAVVALLIVAALVVTFRSASSPQLNPANRVWAAAVRPPVSSRGGPRPRTATRGPTDTRRQRSTRAGTVANQAPVFHASVPAPAPQDTKTTGPTGAEPGVSRGPATHPTRRMPPKAPTKPPITTPGTTTLAIPSIPAGPRLGGHHHAHHRRRHQVTASGGGGHDHGRISHRQG
jgi:hypothetical protein